MKDHGNKTCGLQKCFKLQYTKSNIKGNSAFDLNAIQHHRLGDVGLQTTRLLLVIVVHRFADDSNIPTALFCHKRLVRLRTFQPEKRKRKWKPKILEGRCCEKTLQRLYQVEIFEDKVF